MQARTGRSAAYREVSSGHDGVGEVAHDGAQEGGCAGVVLRANEHGLIVSAVQIGAKAAATAASAAAAAAAAVGGAAICWGRCICTITGRAGRICIAAGWARRRRCGALHWQKHL